MCSEGPVYLFVKSGKEFSVAGWESVPPIYTISFRRGIKFIEDAAKKYGIKTYPVDSLETMVRLLDIRRVGAIIGTSEHHG